MFCLRYHDGSISLKSIKVNLHLARDSPVVLCLRSIVGLAMFLEASRDTSSVHVVSSLCVDSLSVHPHRHESSQRRLYYTLTHSIFNFNFSYTVHIERLSESVRIVKRRRSYVKSWVIFFSLVSFQSSVVDVRVIVLDCRSLCSIFQFTGHPSNV